LNIILKNNWITIVANEEIMYSEFMVYIRWGNLTEMEDAVKQYNQGLLSIYSEVDKTKLFAIRIVL
jgi:hypothetical protein